MVEIGKFNTLRVVKEVDFGIYLDGGEEYGEILMPARYVPENVEPDDELEVFIYNDSEDRVIATTEKPYAKVGDFKFLKVKAVNRTGAFFDWGLPKDLLVPFREQRAKMTEGRTYLVHVYLDTDTDRVVASAKIDKFLDNILPEYESGEEVDLLIAEKTDMGYKVIINNTHWGMIYDNEIFGPVETGDYVKGYIKKVRDDDKIDVALQKEGYEQVDSISQNILDKLKDAGGFLAVSDKSPAEMIYHLFGISKKNFKKAIGALYKKKIITIGNDGIRLS
ncbi:MAG: GntR family transcriptional regulator [Chlorobi bacterium]|nr:GntR family transcriptional regulator [Chlorobiota bacterium]